MNNISAEDVVTNATCYYGISIMGDDFIGYKFVGKNSEFWNSLLELLYDKGENIADTLNSEWLKGNGIKYLEYNSEVWSA